MRAGSQISSLLFYAKVFLQKTNISGNVDWTARLIPERYWSRERWTLVDNPIFYARARAGFGLSYGRPFITPGYRGWGHHYGSGGRSSSGGSGG